MYANERRDAPDREQQEALSELLVRQLCEHKVLTTAYAAELAADFGYSPGTGGSEVINTVRTRRRCIDRGINLQKIRYLKWTVYVDANLDLETETDFPEVRQHLDELHRAEKEKRAA